MQFESQQMEQITMSGVTITFAKYVLLCLVYNVVTNRCDYILSKGIEKTRALLILYVAVH